MKHLWFWIFSCCLAAVKSTTTQTKDIYCYSHQYPLVPQDTVWRCDPASRHCSKTVIELEKNATDCLTSLKACQLICNEYASLWPKPSKMTFNKKLKPIDVGTISFDTKISHNNSEFWNQLESLKNYFLDSVGFEFRNRRLSATKGELKIAFIVKDSATLVFANNVDESYNLFITSSNESVTIEAKTYLGLHHGIETLLQLIIYDSVSNKILIPTSLSVTDKPAFTYRGVLLDTSRSYYSVRSIKKLLDGMGYNKLNTFHWHITDSHSFPYVSKTYPKMSKYGAYSPSQVYSWSDIKDIVRYAKVRGIRVIPELDTPSHVGEGWQGFQSQDSPVVLCFNAEPWRHYCVEPPCGILNPINPKVYEILKNVYGEFNELFPSDLFHMGGDEVSFVCWNETKVIIDWIHGKDKNRTEETFLDLWASFHSQAKAQLDAVTIGEKKKIVLWTSSLTESEKVTTYLDPKHFIIQVWTKGDDKQISKLLNDGYELILSNYDALYLDCGYGAWIGEGNNWCSPYTGWQKIYENRPYSLLSNLNKTYGVARADASNLILGAEAALWSEQGDSSTLDARIWPRASALAERLWSNPDSKWSDATDRLLYQRDRMVSRNLNCEQVAPTWCLQNQGHCK